MSGNGTQASETRISTLTPPTTASANRTSRTTTSTTRIAWKFPPSATAIGTMCRVTHFWRLFAKVCYCEGVRELCHTEIIGVSVVSLSQIPVRLTLNSNRRPWRAHLTHQPFSYCTQAPLIPQAFFQSIFVECVKVPHDFRIRMIRKVKAPKEFTFTYGTSNGQDSTRSWKVYSIDHGKRSWPRNLSTSSSIQYCSLLVPTINCCSRNILVFVYLCVSKN